MRTEFRAFALWLCIGLFATGCSSGGSDGPPPAANVATPDAVGATQAQAEADIRAAGLIVGTVTQQSSNTVPLGNVISQNPAAGAMIATGSSVNLVVSAGPANITVPDVTGLSEAQAGSDITGAGLQVGTVTQQNDNAVPAGNVISQNPGAGTLVAPGSAVDLVVSLGPGTISVPNVIGLSEAQAGSDITGAGLQVGTVTQQNDNAVPAGDVISQNPGAGTLVLPGSSVDLVISLGPSAGGYGDEFSNDSLADWSLRHVVEGTSAQYTTLDVNQTRTGHLTIIPTQTPGWLNGDDGPFIYKSLTGNFSVHTRVLADSNSNPGQPPSANFNSAGLLVRDPSSISGPENWVMLNIGRQGSALPTGVGSEYKNTVNSVSGLTLQDGSNEGDLVLCRVGNNIITFRMLNGDGGWIELSTFDRSDFATTLQVGMVVNGFASPVDLRAEFDFIRLLPTPTSASECTP